jgi:hypothetical protein
LGAVFVDGGREGRERGLEQVIAKRPIFYTIVTFLVQWGLSLASIGALESKVTFLSTKEANFGSLFTGGQSYIHDQHRRAMYIWIGAPVEIVTPLLAIVVLPILWGLCRILRGLRPIHILFSNDLGLVAIKALDTLESGNTHLSWLILWASLWTLIYIMSFFVTLKANLVKKGY